MPQHRNPILKLGQPPHDGYTKVPDDLLRHGVAEMGGDAVLVLQYLMSQRAGWETSTVAIAAQFGWGDNRWRSARALKSLVKVNRLVIRDHMTLRNTRIRQQYIVKADGSKFTDAEMDEWSAPVIRPAKGCTESVQALEHD